MNVIFLDIDGVLNNYERSPWVHSLDWTNWDKVSLETLQQIVDTTGAVIVISSTWRKHQPSVVWWNEQFALAGLRAECIDITGCSSNGFRGREVAEWLDVAKDLYGEIDYVILDDDGDFYPEQNRVWIDGCEGLNGSHWAQTVALLQGCQMVPISCMEERNPPCSTS